MITKKSLRELDDIGFLGTQKTRTKKEWEADMKKTSEALKKLRVQQKNREHAKEPAN